MDSRAAEAAVVAVGERRRGVVAAASATAVGVSARQVRHQVERGRLVRVGRGVYRLRGHPFDWAARLQALLDLAGPGAAAFGRSAARLHRVHAHVDDDALEVVVARGRDQRTSLGRIVQSRHLPSGHLTEVDGFPVTTIARTCFDLAGDPRPELRVGAGKLYHERAVARLVNDALARRGLTFAAEVSVLLSHGRRGRNGTRLVRDLLEAFGPEHTPTWSDAEHLYVEVVGAAGLPVGERQVPMAGEQGFIGTVDVLYRPERLVVEVDSRWHDGPLDRVEDRRRDEALAAAGYEVLRVRYGELALDPGAVLARLRPHLQPNRV